MDDEILQMFIEESREHLSTIENDLLRIEERGANIDDELVNKVFRAAHSIKGGASFLNLVKIKELSHKIENVLDLIRSKELVPNPEIVNILLIGFDKLRDLVNNVEESGNADISDLVVSLSGLASSYLAKDDKESIRTLVDICLASGRKVMEVAEFDLTHARRGGNFIYLVEYDLIHDLHTVGKTPLDLLRDMSSLGSIIDSVVDIDAVGTLDDEPVNRIPFYVLFTTIVEPEMMSTAFEIAKEKILFIPDTQKEKTRTKAPKVPHHEKSSELKPAAPSVRAVPPKQEETGIVCPVPEILPAVSRREEKPAEQPKETHARESPAGNGGSQASPGHAEASIRVSVNVLETLMNLAGEMVLSRNQLLQAIAQKDIHLIERSGQRINVVTSELQEAIMLTRMQPIANVFNKFPRVARDLARELGKDVRLDITGKEVELDKTIIEGLSDPLTHLVRNAVDHGIELPDQRIQAGKNSAGVINLKAYHEAGQVNIEITDDGKGIDPERISQSAVRKNIVSAEQVKVMSDKEKIALILLPGLSTAEQITDVSGRGVGMDVVKTNLDKLGGTIEIDSEPGKGSLFRIKLPLTLAIIPCLLVSVSRERFAIPQINVEELIHIPAAQIRDRIEIVGDAEVLILRGEMIPIIHLASVLGIRKTFVHPDHGEIPDRRKRVANGRKKAKPLFNDQENSAPHAQNGKKNGNGDKKDDERRYRYKSNLNILVVSTGIFRYGLVVEEFHDSVEIVVKPLGRHLKHIRNYAGVTIMGDGRAALILDVGGLASVAGLSSLSGSSRAQEIAEKAEMERYQNTQSLLLFFNSPGEQCAVPIDLVERVEMIDSSQVEMVGGTRVMQHRGQSMPLFKIEDVSKVHPIPDHKDLIVIVFSISGREIGLLGIPPVDSIETAFIVDSTTLKQPGIMGSLIINNRTTLVVDIFELIETIRPVWYEGHNRQQLPEGAKTAILLAEDSDFFRKQVTRYVEEDGYRVFAAPDGLDAWNMLQANAGEITVVVTDIEMPNLDGYGLTKKIKGDARFSHLPVIAVTSLAGDEDFARGKEAGIDDYQVKLDKEKLLGSIRDFIGKIKQ